MGKAESSSRAGILDREHEDLWRFQSQNKPCVTSCPSSSGESQYLTVYTVASYDELLLTAVVWLGCTLCTCTLVFRCSVLGSGQLPYFANVFKVPTFATFNAIQVLAQQSSAKCPILSH